MADSQEPRSGILSVGGTTYGESSNNAGVLTGNMMAYGDITLKVDNRRYSSKKRRQSTDPDQRSKILTWLSVLDFGPAQERIINPIPEEAGQWLLDSDEFSAWRERSARKLLLFGMPGAGKTVLASVVIRHLIALQRQFKEQSAHIVYIFLSHREARSLEQLLGAVARQLVQDMHPLSSETLDLFAKRQPAPPTKGDLLELISSLLADRAIYVIVDALDECNDSRISSTLVHELSKIGPDCCILATSRLTDVSEDIAKENFRKVEVRAQAEDIYHYVKQEIANHPRLSQFAKQDRVFERDMQEKISSKSRGMFLLAKFHMESLAPELYLSDLRKKLNRLPDGENSLWESYDETLSRIEKQADPHKELAFRVLAWVLYSARPLRINELQHALATLHAFNVSPKSEDVDFDMCPLVDDVVTFCCGLITVDTDTQFVRLVHPTAQHYFELRNTILPVDDLKIAQVCARYLCLPQFQQEEDKVNKTSRAYDLYDDPDYYSDNDLDEIRRDTWQHSRSRFEEHTRFRPVANNVHGASGPGPGYLALSFGTKLRMYPFVRYASEYIGYHLRRVKFPKTDALIPDMLHILLSERPRRAFFLRVLQGFRLYPTEVPLYPWCALDYSSDEMDEIDIYPDLEDLDDDYELFGTMPTQDEAHSSSGTSGRSQQLDDDLPITLETMSSTTESCPESEAIPMGEQMSSEDSKQRTAASAPPVSSSANGIAAWDFEPKTALPRSTTLQSTSLSNSRDSWHSSQSLASLRDTATAPELAADPIEIETDTTESVQSLTMPTSNEPTAWGEITPLHLASLIGCQESVRRFSRSSENMDALDCYGQTALDLAVSKDYPDVIMTLVEHGASIDLETRYGHTILQHGAYQGNETFVSHVLELAGGSKPYWRSWSRFGAWMMLEGIRFRQVRASLETWVRELLAAVSCGAEGKVWRYGMIVETSTQEQQLRAMPSQASANRCRLLAAVWWNDEQSLRHLLKKYREEYDHEQQLFLRTAFLLAVARSDVALVTALMDHGVDINARGYKGQSALHIAAVKQRIAVVQVLLERDIKVDAKDEDGETAWSMLVIEQTDAARQICNMLKAAGADPNTRTWDGVSRLYGAAAGGNEEAVRWLLESGVDPSIRTAFGWAPLHWAAHNDCPGCVRLLLDKGADLNPLSDQMTTPLDMAFKANVPHIVEMLKERGAKTATEVYRERAGGQPTFTRNPGSWPYADSPPLDNNG